MNTIFFIFLKLVVWLGSYPGVFFRELENKPDSHPVSSGSDPDPVPLGSDLIPIFSLKLVSDQ